jgi:hypothetical protein
VTTATASPVPWQLTGNHWLALPCVHPADGAVHAVGVMHRGARAAVEFAGNAAFLSGAGAPLLRPVVHVNGVLVDLARQGMAWERAHHWLPTFTCHIGSAVVRGTVFAPFGRDTDIAGAVYALSVENRGDTPVEVTCGVEGRLGHRQLRVQTARPIAGAVSASVRGDDIVVLQGDDVPGLAALAVAGEAGASAAVTGADFAIHRTASVAPGQRAEHAFYLGAGPEADGAAAVVEVLRQRGWRAMLAGTRDALRMIEQGSGVEAVDGLINRNLLFCYFYSVGRALDDAHYYIVRSRAPWSPRGLTVRDWEALMWTVPAVQVADAPLARELILRMCEVHGYAPGRGVNYLDGTLFAPGFTLEGASAYAIATDRYIRDTGDDRIVEDTVLADTLYLSSDDLADRRDEHFPLYRADVTLGGVASSGFVLHANAAVAYALECLKRTLDENEAKSLEDPEAVRAALRRHFVVGDASKSAYASAVTPGGAVVHEDDPRASALWLPLLEAVERTDSAFRRTAKAIPVEQGLLETRIARLTAPDASEALDWLRRAPLDGGLAAEVVDAGGGAVAGGADAALAGLLASTVWFVVHAHGVRP